LGDVDVTTADQTQAVAWNISGKLDAKKLPTVGGALKVGGEAVFAETFTTGSAAINIGGKAEFKGALNAAANAAITVGGNLDVTGAFTTGTGAVNVAGGLAVGTSTTAANTSLGGNLTVGGTATFTGTFANTAGATATFGGATTITGVLTTGTGGLTIAGTGAVDLKAAPVTDTAKLLTVSNSGGVTLKEGINVGTVVGGLTIVAPGKVILSTGKAITADATGTVKAAEWSIGTAAGTATAAGDIILTDTGIKGAASGAKLTLAASGILVGLNGGAAIGATFDGVDVYLGGTTASVKIESGSSVSDVTTLTLANGAKISGLTGAAATGTAVATTTTGGAALGITNIDAVTGTVDEANAGNYLGIKTGASGTIAAAYNGAQKNYTIAIGTKATGTGA
jgi:hypothetical protein